MGKNLNLSRRLGNTDIVGLTSTHSSGSLFFAGVVVDERQKTGVGLLIAPQFSSSVFFYPGGYKG